MQISVYSVAVQGAYILGGAETLTLTGSLPLKDIALTPICSMSF